MNLVEIAQNVSRLFGLVRSINNRIGYVCLIRGDSTGARKEIQTSTIGNDQQGTISTGRRYIIPNPFGINTPVIVQVEIFANNRWAKTGHQTNVNTGAGIGVDSSYVQGEGIIIQTGSGGLILNSLNMGGGHGTNIAVNSARCRVHVWKVAV